MGIPLTYVSGTTQAGGLEELLESLKAPIPKRPEFTATQRIFGGLGDAIMASATVRAGGFSQRTWMPRSSAAITAGG